MKTDLAATFCKHSSKAFLCLLVCSLLADIAIAQNNKIEKRETAIGGLVNATIYASRFKPATFDELQELAKQSGAKLELLKGEKDDWQSVKLTWEGKSLQVNRDDGEGLDEHLQGFTGYVYSQLASETMDALVFATIRQIRRTNHVYGFVAEPAFHDDSGKFISLFAKQQNALVFMDDSVWSPEIKMIIGTADHRDDEAELPVFESATERRDRINKKLTEVGVPTNPDLPVIVTDEEVEFRDAKQVARRVLCLFAVAHYAAGAKEFKPIEFLEKHDAWSEISGEEKAFVEAATPSKETANTLTWRYESCQALLWCLDQRTIDFPNEMIDVQALTEVVLENAATMVESAKLRSTKEILDHSDLVYRCLWAGRNSRRAGKEVSEVNLSVVYERAYALNWITRLLNADWDFVPTDS